MFMAKLKITENQNSSRPDERGEERVQSTGSGSSDEHSRIARRAYELYLERGGSHGQDWEDWLAAEREIRGSRQE
jgi:Protein of unknown function (DUF2934)